MARPGRYRRIEIQVGVFSLLGILVLVVGLLWLRDFRFSRRYNVYKAFFTDTGGLVPGDVVMVAGFRKGNVRQMHLLERGVEVDLAVEQDVILHEDARAIIGTRGLLGERYVELNRGVEERVLPPGSMLRGESQIGMGELMAVTGDLLRSARAASDEVRQILSSLSRASQDEQLTQGIRDAAVAATELRATLQANRAAFEATVENFRRASETLAQVTGRTEDDIVALTRDMRTAAADLDSLMGDLQTAAGKTNRVADRLLQDDTTFGRLVTDRELYERLLRVTTRADSLIAAIQSNPKRFFSLSIV
jgi:phospholipid/cholesterol/gamma-HCH transport system substrate-binding protein